MAQSALWAAGYSPREQHLLATLASVARTDLDAGTVEIVLAPPGFGGDGVVVTGSRMGTQRLGVRITAETGTAGRALATGRAALAEPRVAMAVPIRGSTRLVGVVVVVSAGPERLFGGREVARLEALVAQTARQLAAPVGRTA